MPWKFDDDISNESKIIVVFESRRKTSQSGMFR